MKPIDYKGYVIKPYESRLGFSSTIKAEIHKDGKRLATVKSVSAAKRYITLYFSA